MRFASWKLASVGAALCLALWAAPAGAQRSDEMKGGGQHPAPAMRRASAANSFRIAPRSRPACSRTSRGSARPAAPRSAAASRPRPAARRRAKARRAKARRARSAEPSFELMEEGRARRCVRPFRIYIAGSVSRENRYARFPRNHPDRIGEPLSPAALQALEPQVRGRIHARARDHPVRRDAPLHARCLARRLALRIEAADDATLERTQGVVIDHLKRFAFREELGDVRWERA